ncbi:MAG: tetratricopeptide repeat protein, partial [Planctomycetes bacterium]|nr:tetratricopeptide repeat protein [Planctomycetota bacterium]
LGMLLALKGDLPRAIHHFQASLAGEPDDPQVHYNLGAAYFQTQQHSLAIEHFREAVRRRPKYGRAWLSLGIGLVTIGNVAEAQDAFQMAKDIPESAAAARYRLGILSPESDGDKERE